MSLSRLRWESFRQPSSVGAGGGVCRPCRGWRCVCAAEIGSGETGSGEVECFTAAASLHQSAAKVWPLCGFGGHVPVGASGWQEKWAVNKAGSRQVPHAQQMTDPCAARRLLQLMTVGASAWERPPGPQQVPVGAVPAALLLFPRGGSSPMPSGSPRGGCPSLGRCRGRRENGAPLWGAGLPLPPSSTAKIQAGCPAYGGSDGAVEGCRGRRVGIKTSVRRPGRRQPLMVLTELLWSVVWKICILRRARGGRGTADRGGT